MKEKHKENENQFLVDVVADITRMKGTGTWTVQSALELLVPVPTIASAVFSREMSQEKDLRLKMSKFLPISLKIKLNEDKEEIVNIAHDALRGTPKLGGQIPFLLRRQQWNQFTMNEKHELSRLLPRGQTLKPAR